MKTPKIPMWLLRFLPMWEYICPKCRKTVKANSHHCPHCGERFPQAIRIPPTMLKNRVKLEDYVHKHVFPRISAFERNYLAQYFTILFSDSFASGSASAWSGTVGSPTFVTSPTNNGDAYSMYISANGAQGCYENITASSGPIHCRLYVYFSVLGTAGGTGSEMDIISMLSSGGYGAIARAYYDGTTTWFQFLNNYYDDTITTSVAISTNTWYCVELLYYKYQVGQCELWINGVLEATETGNNPNTQITIVYAGGVDNGNHYYYHAYFDDVVIADTYIGPLSSTTSVNVSDSGSGSDSVSVQAAISEVDTCSGVENLAAVPIFQDNFAAEGAAGSLSSSLWNVSIKDVALTQTPVYNGNSWSARASADGNQSWLITRFSQTYKTLYARAYFYYEEYPVYNTNAWWDLFIEYYDTGSSTLTFIADFGLAQNASGQYVWDLVYNNNGWGHEEQSAQQTNPSLNTWYCLELMVTADSSVGEIRCWVNGSELTDMHLTGLNTTATAINQFALFDTYYTTDASNCVVSTSYNGPIGYAQNLVQASIPVSDLGTGADSLSVSGSSPSVSVSDSGLGSDALSSVNVQVPLADSGSGADSAIIGSSVNVSDSGLGSDALLSIIAQILAADSGLGTESLVLGSPVNLSDSGSGSDALVIQAQIVLTDVGAGLDSAIVKVSTTISDVGLGSDVLTVSVPISLSDAGLGTDMVNVVIVAALPTHAIIIQTEKGTVTLQSDSD